MTVVENSLVCVAFVIHSRCVEARLPWVGPGANKEVNISLSVFPGAGLSLSRVRTSKVFLVCVPTNGKKEGKLGLCLITSSARAWFSQHGLIVTKKGDRGCCILFHVDAYE